MVNIDLDSVIHEEAKERFERMISKYMRERRKTRHQVLSKLIEYVGGKQADPRRTLTDMGLHFEDVEKYLLEIKQAQKED